MHLLTDYYLFSAANASASNSSFLDDIEKIGLSIKKKTGIIKYKVNATASLTDVEKPKEFKIIPFKGKNQECRKKDNTSIKNSLS